MKKHTPNKTQVRGEDAEWDAEIWAKWNVAMDSPDAAMGVVLNANYFTPRPYRNEYDRGNPDEGFTFTLKPYGRPNAEVHQVVINAVEVA